MKTYFDNISSIVRRKLYFCRIIFIKLPNYVYLSFLKFLIYINPYEKCNRKRLFSKALLSVYFRNFITRLFTFYLYIVNCRIINNGFIIDKLARLMNEFDLSNGFEILRKLQMIFYSIFKKINFNSHSIFKFFIRYRLNLKSQKTI